MAENKVNIVLSADNKAGGAFASLIRDTDTLRLKTNGLEAAFKQYSATAGAFAAASFFVESIKAAETYQNSLRGLASIARYTGADIGASMQAASRLTADGLLTVSEAATSLKNLLSRGFSLDESIQLIERFKDSAAFGRQASLSMGEAVRSATEGLKNENSILVDNAGVTKNVSAMWKDYAAAHNTTADKLTITQKRQAELVGILRETEGQLGNAAIAAGGLTGQYARLNKATQDFMVQIGTTLSPVAAELAGFGTGLIKNFVQPTITGIELITVKLAGLSEKLINFWNKGTNTKDIAAIDENVEAGIAAIMKKYEGAITPDIGKDSGKRLAREVGDEVKSTTQTVKEAEATWKEYQTAMTSTLSGEAAEIAKVRSAYDEKREAVEAQYKGQATSQKELNDLAALDAAEQRDLAAVRSKSAKEHQKDLDVLADKYLPLKAEANELKKAHAGLVEMLGSGAITGAEFAVAMDKLYSSTISVKEAEESAAKATKEASETWKTYRANLEAITSGAMSDHEKKVYDIEKAYDILKEKLADMIVLNQISNEAANALADKYDAKAAAEISALDQAEDKHKEVTTEVDKLWGHTWERMTDLTGDWLSGEKNALDNFGDYFEKLVAQMVATWGMGQAKMIFTGGGSMATTGAFTSSGNSAVDIFSFASTMNSLRGGVSTVGAGLNSLQGFTAQGLEALGFGTVGATGSYGVMAPGATGVFGTGTYGSGSIMAGGGSTGAAGAVAEGSSWSAAMPYLAAATSAFNAYSAFKDGNEIGGTAHTVATALALSGNVPGAVIVEIGNFIGEKLGLWGGGGENEFTLSELSGKTDSTWDRNAGFAANAATGSPQGPDNGWYGPIDDAYSSTMNEVQTGFNTLVDGLKSQMSAEAWNAFATALESQTFDDQNGGRWGVSGAQGAITQSVEAYSKTLTAGLNTALQKALPIIANELTGDSSAYALLTDGMQAAIQTAIGGSSFGTTQLGQLQAYLTKIAQAIAPIKEANDTHGLSDYELSLRQINQQFAAYADQLRAAGVDLAKYTDLERARLNAIADTIVALQDTTAGAGRSYLQGLTAERDLLQGNVDRARNGYLEMLTKEHGALDSLKAPLVSSINAIRNARKDLYSQAGGLLPGDQQLNAIRAEIERQRAIATGNDPEKAADALAQIESLSGEYLAVSKGMRTDWRDAARDLAYIDDLLNVSEAAAVTQRDEAQTQIDRLDALAEAVNGVTDTAITLDQARQQYEQAVFALESSGLQTQIDYLSSLYTNSTNIETLLAEFLGALATQGSGMAAAGQTEQWIATPGTSSQAYRSTGGATAIAPIGADSFAQVGVIGKNGRTFNAQTAIDAIDTMLAGAAGDTAALNAAGLQIYSAAKDYGVSSADLERMMGWASGSVSQWTDAQGLQRFATGGSFTVAGMGGVDNLGLPRLRVSAGEIVNVSRQDSMAALRDEVRGLRQEAAQNNQALVAIAKHSEKTSSTVSRWDYAGLPPVAA